MLVSVDQSFVHHHRMKNLSERNTTTSVFHMFPVEQCGDVTGGFFLQQLILATVRKMFKCFVTVGVFASSRNENGLKGNL